MDDRFMRYVAKSDENMQVLPESGREGDIVSVSGELYYAEFAWTVEHLGGVSVGYWRLLSSVPVS